MVDRFTIFSVIPVHVIAEIVVTKLYDPSEPPVIRTSAPITCHQKAGISFQEQPLPLKVGGPRLHRGFASCPTETGFASPA